MKYYKDYYEPFGARTNALHTLLHVATRAMRMQQSQRNGFGDGLAAGADDQFFHRVAQVVFDGEHGQAEDIGDFVVGQTNTNPKQHHNHAHKNEPGWPSAERAGARFM